MLTSVACLSITRPHSHTLHTSTLHHSRPLRRTSHNPPTAHTPISLAPSSPDNTTTVLRTWTGREGMAEDR